MSRPVLPALQVQIRTFKLMKRVRRLVRQSAVSTTPTRTNVADESHDIPQKVPLRLSHAQFGISLEWLQQERSACQGVV